MLPNPNQQQKHQAVGSGYVTHFILLLVVLSTAVLDLSAAVLAQTPTVEETASKPLTATTTVAPTPTSTPSPTSSLTLSWSGSPTGTVEGTFSLSEEGSMSFSKSLSDPTQTLSLSAELSMSRSLGSLSMSESESPSEELSMSISRNSISPSLSLTLTGSASASGSPFTETHPTQSMTDSDASSTFSLSLSESPTISITVSLSDATNTLSGKTDSETHSVSFSHPTPSRSLSPTVSLTTSISDSTSESFSPSESWPTPSLSVSQSESLSLSSSISATSSPTHSKTDSLSESRSRSKPSRTKPTSSLTLSPTPVETETPTFSHPTPTLSDPTPSLSQSHSLSRSQSTSASSSQSRTSSLTETDSKSFPTRPLTRTSTFTKSPTPSLTPSLSSSVSSSRSHPSRSLRTSTISKLPTITETESISSTPSVSVTSSHSMSQSATNSKTASLTHSSSVSASQTVSSSMSLTPSSSPSPSDTATPSTSHSMSQTDSKSLTATSSPSQTVSQSVTASTTKSMTNTHSQSRSTSQSHSESISFTYHDLASRTKSLSHSRTQSHTLSSSVSLTETPAATETPTLDRTRTETYTRSPTLTSSLTLSHSQSSTSSRSTSLSISVSQTHSLTPSISATETSTLSPSEAPTRTATFTPSMSDNSESITPPPTITQSATITPAPTRTATFTPSSTFTTTHTLSATVTPAPTATITHSHSRTVSLSLSETLSLSFPTFSLSPSWTPSLSLSATPSATLSDSANTESHTKPPTASTSWWTGSHSESFTSSGVPTVTPQLSKSNLTDSESSTFSKGSVSTSATYTKPETASASHSKSISLTTSLSWTETGETDSMSDSFSLSESEESLTLTVSDNSATRPDTFTETSSLTLTESGPVLLVVSPVVPNRNLNPQDVAFTNGRDQEAAASDPYFFDPKLYADAIATGSPLYQRRLVFELIGGQFDLAAADAAVGSEITPAPSSETTATDSTANANGGGRRQGRIFERERFFFDNIKFDVTKAPVFSSRLFFLWSTSAIVVNATGLSMTFPPDEKFEMEEGTVEEVTITFLHTCFVDHQVPSPHQIRFAIYAGDSALWENGGDGKPRGSVIDEEGVVIKGQTEDGSWVTPLTPVPTEKEVADGIGVVATGGTASLGATAAGLSIPKALASLSIAACNGVYTPLTIFEHPTTVSIGGPHDIGGPLPGLRPQLATYLGAMVMNPVLVIGILMIHLGVGLALQTHTMFSRRKQLRLERQLRESSRSPQRHVTILDQNERDLQEEGTRLETSRDVKLFFLEAMIRVHFPAKSAWLLLLYPACFKCLIAIYFASPPSSSSPGDHVIVAVIATILMLLCWVVPILILGLFIFSHRFFPNYKTKRDLRHEVQARNNEQLFHLQSVAPQHFWTAAPASETGSVASVSTAGGGGGGNDPLWNISMRRGGAVGNNTGSGNGNGFVNGARVNTIADSEWGGFLKSSNPLVAFFSPRGTWFEAVDYERYLSESNPALFKQHMERKKKEQRDLQSRNRSGSVLYRFHTKILGDFFEDYHELRFRGFLFYELFTATMVAACDGYAVATQSCRSMSILLLIVLAVHFLVTIGLRPYDVSGNNVFFTVLSFIQLVLAIIAVVATHSSASPSGQIDSLLVIVMMLQYIFVIKAVWDLLSVFYLLYKNKIRGSTEANSSTAGNRKMKTSSAGGSSDGGSTSTGGGGYYDDEGLEKRSFTSGSSNGNRLNKNQFQNRAKFFDDGNLYSEEDFGDEMMEFEGSGGGRRTAGGGGYLDGGEYSAPSPPRTAPPRTSLTSMDGIAGEYPQHSATAGSGRDHFLSSTGRRTAIPPPNRRRNGRSNTTNSVRFEEDDFETTEHGLEESIFYEDDFIQPPSSSATVGRTSIGERPGRHFDDDNEEDLGFESEYSLQTPQPSSSSHHPPMRHPSLRNRQTAAARARAQQQQRNGTTVMRRAGGRREGSPLGPMKPFQPVGGLREPSSSSRQDQRPPSSSPSHHRPYSVPPVREGLNDNLLFGEEEDFGGGGGAPVLPLSETSPSGRALARGDARVTSTGNPIDGHDNTGSTAHRDVPSGAGLPDPFQEDDDDPFAFADDNSGVRGEDGRTGGAGRGVLPDEDPLRGLL